MSSPLAPLALSLLSLPIANKVLNYGSGSGVTSEVKSHLSGYDLWNLFSAFLGKSFDYKTICKKCFRRPCDLPDVGPNSKSHADELLFELEPIINYCHLSESGRYWIFKCLTAIVDLGYCDKCLFPRLDLALEAAKRPYPLEESIAVNPESDECKITIKWEKKLVDHLRDFAPNRTITHTKIADLFPGYRVTQKKIKIESLDLDFATDSDQE